MGLPHVSPSYFARSGFLAGAMTVVVCGLCLRAFGYDVGLPFVAVKYGGSVLWGAMVYLLLAAFFPSRWNGYEVHIEPRRLGRRPQLVRSRGYDKQDDEQIFS